MANLPSKGGHFTQLDQMSQLGGAPTGPRANLSEPLGCIPLSMRGNSLENPVPDLCP